MSVGLLKRNEKRGVRGAEEKGGERRRERRRAAERGGGERRRREAEERRRDEESRTGAVRRLRPATIVLLTAGMMAGEGERSLSEDDVMPESRTKEMTCM